MIVGCPPFYAANSRQELLDKIKHYTPKYPSTLSLEVKNLLEQLFRKNPLERLGYGVNGAVNIKNHPWFDKVNWNAILNR